MGTTARALRFAALYNMVPIPWLKRNYARFNTPVTAILIQVGRNLCSVSFRFYAVLNLQAVCVAVLMSFSFDVLVVLNVLFYNFGLLLQFAAFLRLKYIAKHTHRCERLMCACYVATV